MSRRQFRGATVIISGAASGVGRALALRFVQAGARSVLLDLDAPGLASVEREIAALGGESLSITCDVTDAEACAAAVAGAHERFARVDVLVNNAGITHRSPFATTRAAVLRRVIEVNLFGAINLTRAAVAHLARSRGMIIVISSVAGFTPLIARTGYAASKHALHGFFDSLRSELEPDGVDVMIVCPAFIETGIDRHAFGPDGHAATHAQVVVGRRLTAEFVADRVVGGAAKGSRLLLIGATARAAWWLSRISPALYERIMARRLRGEMQ